MPICKSCGKEIQFIKIKSGKSMPTDMTRLNLVTSDGDVVFGYRPHWVTCDDPTRFKNGKHLEEGRQVKGGV